MSTICSAAELSERLRQGEAVVFPTDTLPALAARPEAAERLWELKHRPRSKPVILMAATSEELLDSLQMPIEPAWRSMAERHWPGPLTLVLPARGPLLELLNPGGSTLGLRLPGSHLALKLLEQSGPLATTSTNRSGETACLTASEAAERFPQVAQLAPVPWPTPSGCGSTVIAWTGSGSGWTLLREGALLPPELQSGEH